MNSFKSCLKFLVCGYIFVNGILLIGMEVALLWHPETQGRTVKQMFFGPDACERAEAKIDEIKAIVVELPPIGADIDFAVQSEPRGPLVIFHGNSYRGLSGHMTFETDSRVVFSITDTGELVRGEGLSKGESTLQMIRIMEMIIPEFFKQVCERRELTGHGVVSDS